MTTDTTDTDTRPYDARTISFVLDGQTVPYLEEITYAPEDGDDEQTIEIGMDQPPEVEIDADTYVGTVVVHLISPALERLVRLYEHQREFNITISIPWMDGRTYLRFISCTIDGYSYRKTADSETVIEFDWRGVLAEP